MIGQSRLEAVQRLGLVEAAGYEQAVAGSFPHRIALKERRMTMMRAPYVRGRYASGVLRDPSAWNIQLMLSEREIRAPDG